MKSSIYKTFGTDPSKRVEGVWVDFDPNEDGSVPGVLIARMSDSNPKYQKELEAYAQKYQVELKHGILSEETAKQPFIALFCKTIVLDWRNLYRQDGTPFGDYTPELGVEVMNDLPDFYGYLRDKAMSIQTFRDAEIANKSGN